MSEGLVWLNGEILDFASARVSVEDRGFQFGDGVYEVVRVYQGKPFALREHLERLQRSAEEIELLLPLSLSELAAAAETLIARAGIAEAELYIQLTRGAARRNHLFPQDTPPTLVMTVRHVRIIPPELREQGVRALTVPDERWARCDIKSICLLPNVLAKERAHRAGAFEALFVRDGLVMEGTSSNVFAWTGEELVTPIADRRILSGITRSFVLQLAREQGYRTVERDLPLSELKSAREVIIAGTVTELLAVIAVDGEPVGDGKPGPIFRQLYAAYRHMIAERAR
ncbi:MAG: D-amino-acid transaminase [Blastocatellia bacterium]|nr:D-amino-acid transaminase [Blastocatellia bacterium]